MKSVRLLKYLLLAVMLIAGIGAKALHIKGGWMYYAYTGKDQSGRNLYEVTVKVYRDCVPPNPGQNDPAINITVYAIGSSSQPLTFSANLSRTYPLEKQSFSECINPKPEVCYVILEYKAQIALAPNATGYTLAFQRCCRINGIVNVQQPSNSLGNTYTLTIPGTQAGATAPENSSPIFAEKDTVVVCYNSEFTLDYSAADADGDSLYYFFTEALNGAGQNNPNPATSPPPPYSGVGYSAGYNAQNPFGSNVTINSRTGIISGRSPNVTGEYVVAVGIREFRNGNYLSETRKELHVNVANCNVAAAKLPVRITSCDGYTVQFENLSSSPAILTYSWDFGVITRSDDTSRSARPTYTYADTGVYKAKLVINRESACADSAYTDVAVYPGFFPDIKYSGACYLIPFNFSDATRLNYGNVNYWRWDFGVSNATADTSRLRNPNFTFPAPGSYNVTLEVGSSLGCLDTITSVVDVLTTPVLSLPFRDTLICSIDSLQLIAEGQGTASWTPTASMINSNSFTPIVFPKATTTYHITLNDRGCVATDSIKVNVLDFITVDLGPDVTICRTDSIQLHAETQGLQFNWTPSSRMLAANVQDPTVYPLDSLTSYIVQANLGKCLDRDTIVVRTVPYPIAKAYADTTVCFGQNAILRGEIVGTSLQWSPSATVSNPGAALTMASPRQTTTYQLAAYDTLGCPKPGLDYVTVTVTPQVIINAGRDTTLVYNQELQLDAQTNMPVSYQWSPATGLSNSTIGNPLALFTENTLPEGASEVRYLLTATTEAGCVGTDEMVIKVFKTGPSIFVPSAFTPNSDGLNDVIRPILAGMKGLDYFRVFNRYGQLVFETKENGKGWNGTIEGNPQSSGAFVYQVQAVTFTGETLQQSGTFVLVR